MSFVCMSPIGSADSGVFGISRTIVAGAAHLADSSLYNANRANGNFSIKSDIEIHIFPEKLEHF